MCTKGGIDPSRMFSHFNRSSKKSILINLIRLMFDRDEQVYSIAQLGFRTLLSNGLNVDF